MGSPHRKKTLRRPRSVHQQGVRVYSARYLIPRSEFERKVAQNGLHVSVPTSHAIYLEQRMSLLKQALDHTNALASAGELPDVELSTAGLKSAELWRQTKQFAAWKFLGEFIHRENELVGLLPNDKVSESLSWSIH